MVYIFSAMTNLAIEVRLMAFKFLDLVIQNYPSTFSMYAEKILQNYGDILQKNKFFLQDKGKIKTGLSGLVRCLSLLPFKNRSAGDLSDKKDIPVQVTLHAFVPDISSDSSGLSSSGVVEKLKNLLPALVSCFQDPLVHNMPQMDTQSYDCMLLILRNIDLLVRFFILESPYHHTHVNISDQRISLLALKKHWDEFPFNPTHDLSKKENDRYFKLNIVITEIFLKISHWDHPPPALMEKFLEFIEISLSEKICHHMESSKVIHEKQLLALVSFTPELIMRVSGFWKSRILEAFTKAFKSCSPESLMKLACLSAIEEMMFSEHDWLYLDTSDPELLHYQITWIRELPSLLIVLGDKHPLSSKTVLRLQLRIGQTAEFDSPFAKEYDEMQYILRGFYSTTCNEGGVSYGPFMTLSRDIQELSLCCLYYFSILDSTILQSLVSCCLSHELEPCLVLRILEVLHTAYKAGHIQIADYISFLITLVSRLHAYPDNHEGKSIRVSFRSLTSAVCSCLSQIGDNCFIFQMVERVITDQIFLSPLVDNMNALLRILTAIDTAPTKLSEPSIDKLSRVLPKYLLDVASDLPGEVNEQNSSLSLKRSQYYLLPCFFLFQRSNRLLSKVLKEMGSVLAENHSPPLSYHHEFPQINHKSTLVASVSVLLLLHSDIKMRRVFSSCKPEINSILEYMVALLASEGNNMTIDERHEVQRACDRLTTATTTLLA
ncbi:PREDICTED: uncharacterized protein LOC109160228 isoform X3 [Ipomoea nil]|nr:PREDICTED: uncharacterized protein LOC109160228 isoform X3 [Ipomoea nil]